MMYTIQYTDVTTACQRASFAFETRGLRGDPPNCRNAVDATDRADGARYPDNARKEGVQGIVVLDAVIGADGRIRETRVVKGEDARLVDVARVA
jgi:outer membrane biosynthesis protein TonB